MLIKFPQVYSPSHHHCQGFLSLPNLFHVLPNGRESSCCGPRLRRNDQFPRSPTTTNTNSTSHHLQGVVEPQTRHTKVTSRAGPNNHPHPQQHPLQWPQKEATPTARAKIESLSGCGKLKGSSSGTPTMLYQEGRKQGLEFSHRCNTLSHASTSIHCQLCIKRERGLEGNNRVVPVSLPATGGRIDPCCLFGQSLINCSASDVLLG